MSKQVKELFNELETFLTLIDCEHAKTIDNITMQISVFKRPKTYYFIYYRHSDMFQIWENDDNKIIQTPVLRTAKNAFIKLL